MANDNGNLERITIFPGTTLTVGTHSLRKPISISGKQLIGNVSIHFETTGGTLAIDFKLSNSFNKNDGTGNFVKPSSGSSVVSGHTAGNDHLNIPMNNAEAFDLDFVVSVSPVTISAWLSLQ